MPSASLFKWRHFVAEEVRKPRAIACIGLVSWYCFAMTGIHENDFHKPCKDVEDRLPVHTRALDGYMCTARINK
jgi:hypothetical protein